MKIEEKFKFIGEGFNKTFQTEKEALSFIKDKRPADDEQFVLEHITIERKTIKSNLNNIKHDYKLLKSFCDNLIDILYLTKCSILNNKYNYEKINFCKYCEWSYIIDKNYNAYNYYSSTSDEAIKNRKEYEIKAYQFFIDLIKSFDFEKNFDEIKCYKVTTNFKPCNNICILFPYYYMENDIRYIYFQFREANDIMIDSIPFTGSNNVSLLCKKLIEFDEDLFNKLNKIIKKINIQ